MSDTLNDIAAWALELGATHARVVSDLTLLTPHQAVRDACLQNSCGRSGRCWTCPPYVGELEELGARLAAYPEVLVVQSITTLEDSWDFEGATAALVAHNDLMRALWRRTEAAFPGREVLVVGAGGCGYCPECSCPGEPCRHPEAAMSSIEAHGVDVRTLVEAIGLKYINGKGTVSYVGAVFVR